MPPKKFWDTISKIPNQSVKISPDMESMAYSEWFAQLTLLPSPASSDSGDASGIAAQTQRDQVIAMYNVLGGEGQQVVIKGQGLDTQGVAATTSRCLVNPKKTSQPDRVEVEGGEESGSEEGTIPGGGFSFSQEEDLPVLWSIGHNALATELLVETLESIFPRLFFLC